jgi:hypothetical protein
VDEHNLPNVDNFSQPQECGEPIIGGEVHQGTYPLSTCVPSKICSEIVTPEMSKLKWINVIDNLSPQECFLAGFSLDPSLSM